jgi:Flp pilus assembly protein TadD
MPLEGNQQRALQLALGHFLKGQYDEAAHAAHRAVQANPEFSVSHSLLAAALAEVGQAEAAKAVAIQVMVLQPSFSSHEFCAAVGQSLTEAWCRAGLPP